MFDLVMMVAGCIWMAGVVVIMLICLWDCNGPKGRLNRRAIKKIENLLDKAKKIE